MMKRVLAAIALLAISSLAGEANAGCPEKFEAGRAPALVNQRLGAQTRALCFEAFAVLHSGLTRTPLWSAERLTAAGVEAARGLPRVNQFHAEERLPEDERADLADYARSGFDRGHMAPNGDMPDVQAQQESFSLSNMVPQAPKLNRGLWEGIETAVRDLAIQDGQVYVVTGPIFAGAALRQLNGRVMVPTSVYKAIYDPANNQAGAYLAENVDDANFRAISIAELRTLSGIDPFPGLPESVKARVMDLPSPHRHMVAVNREAGARASPRRSVSSTLIQF